MISLRLALRNLLRNRSRTVLSTLGLVLGLSVLIFSMSLLDGMNEHSLETMIDHETAHLRVFPAGYLEEDFPPAELRIEGADSVARVLARELEGQATVRYRVRAQLMHQREEAFVDLTGVDSETDPQVYTTLQYATENGGGDIHDEGVWLGARLARDLGIQQGDRITLLVRSVPGAFNSRSLQVDGLLKTNYPSVERRMVMVSLPLVRELMLDPAGANEIALRFEERELADERAAALQQDHEGLEGETWRQAAADFIKINQFRRYAFSVVVLILGLIAVVAVSNTMIMAVHERAMEIGAMRAQGFQRGMIARMFLFEGLSIGVMAILLALLLGGGIVLYYGHAGISLSAYEDFDTGLPVTDALYPHLTGSTVVMTLVFGLGLTGMATLGAVRRVLRGQVVRALREGML